MTEVITLTDHAPVEVPRDVAICPICGATLYIEECDGWVEQDGYGVPEAITVTCDTEPDIDGDGDTWEEWFREHYKTPYVDWLPVEQRVLEWFRTHYRFALS